MKVRLHPVRGAPVLRSMAPGPKKTMRTALEALRDDPSGTSNGLNVKRLDADPGDTVYRLRVGPWRAAFSVRPGEILVVRIFHRRDGYGWLADME